MSLFIRAAGPVVTVADVRPDAIKVYNPGVGFNAATGLYVMFLRVVFAEPLHSQIWRAESVDGVNWTGHRPAFVPDLSDPSQARGFEDPRLVFVEDLLLWVLTYAVFDGVNVELHIATSPDLEAWTHHGKALSTFPFVGSGGRHIDWGQQPPVEVASNPVHPDAADRCSKSAVVFPELIDGRLWMFFGEGGCWVASCDPADLTQWDVVPGPLLTSRPDTDLFDNVTVEAASPPIWQPFGWVVLYHGIDKRRRYRVGLIVLALGDPSRLLWRSDEPIFWPEEPYERSGMVDVIPGVPELIAAGNEVALAARLAEARVNGEMPEVTFVSSSLVRCDPAGEDRLIIIYGAGDLVIGTAEAPLSAVLAVIPAPIRALNA